MIDHLPGQPTEDTFLMCAPDHFEVSYVINPWMTGNVAHSNRSVAMQQWLELVEAIGQIANIELVHPKPGVPDLVFTANAGVVLGKKVVLSRFRHVERQAEEAYFEEVFAARGFDVLTLPPELPFEGAGDALMDRSDNLLWFGHGHRSDIGCATKLSELLDIEVQPLKLVDARFYHLDTCFCPLAGGYVMYFPEAFDAASLAHIAARVPADKLIVVGTEDALHFACNTVNSGRHLFLNQASAMLVAKLHARGFVVHQTALTEFLKAGGAAKCLTLKLNEPQQMAMPHIRHETVAEYASH